MAMFVTLAKAKRTLALSNLKSALLTDLIEAASAQVESYLDTPVISAERTEVYNGNGLTQLPLRAIPITALGNIVITDITGTVTTLANTNFDFDSGPGGRIAFSPISTSSIGVFCAGFQNVSVTYTAGFLSGAIPDEIQEATIQIAVGIYIPTAAANPQFAMERMGEYQRTLVAPMSLITPAVEALLAKYRLLRI